MIKSITFRLTIAFIVGMASFSLVKADELLLPITFEDNIDYAWLDFGGATTTIVDNPSMSGINTSNKVSKVVKSGGEDWAGAFVSLVQDVDFSTYKVFKLKVCVPQVGTKVTLKLENYDDSSIYTEVEATSTKANEWEELSFNFTESDVNVIYKKLVVFFDLGTVGDGSAASTYYLDDIFHPGVEYTNDNATGDDPVSLEDYTLVWSDEFDTNGAVDETKWFHQTELPSGGSWYNGEIQHYTDRIENAYVDEGVLKIVAKKESFTDQGVSKDYTSARLNSKFAFTYGRVEIKAQLPSGVGTWPALWMLGKNINEAGAYWQTQGYGTTAWPACGEVDIMEHWGDNPNVVSSAMHTPSSYGGTVNKGEQTISNASSEFHVYAMDWDADKMVFSVDNVVHYTYNPDVKNADTWPYDADQYFIFNIALQNSISSTFTESSLDIDYIRVYQENATSLAEDVESKQDIQLYPNPAADHITFSQEVERVSIFSISGQKVYEYNSKTSRLDISVLKSGSYILKAEKNNEIIIKRIIKK